jgi:hypothetical protein
MKKLILFLSVVTLLNSCKDVSKEIVQNKENKNNSARINTNQETSDGEIVLGAKQTNPYALKNMDIALKELQKIKPEFKQYKINATHKYVRIEAQTEEAFKEIQQNKTLDLYKYPLEYEVKTSGSNYKEKDIESKFQIFWAAVPIDYTFAKDLNVKEIEQLFLPKGNGNTEKDNKPNNIVENHLNAIEEKALQLFDPKYAGGKNKKVTANYVSGTIKVWDDYKQLFMPVKSVQMKGKRWFTTVPTYTDVNGYYYFFYDFSGPADVTIVYENAYFKYQIEKNNWLGNPTWYNAETTKNNVTGSWSPNIEGHQYISYNYYSPDAWRLANSFRASYDYYTKHATAYAIDAPPLSSSFKPCIGIRSNTSSVIPFSHTWATPGLQGGNDIILVISPSSYYTSNFNYTALDIYATTIHEMSHLKHFFYGMTRLNYLSSKTIATLAESYALAVEYRITMDEYNIKNTSTWHYYIKANREYDYKDNQAKGISYFNGWNGTFPLNMASAYTPYFIDMMDDNNQYFTAGSDIAENLQNISLENIEDAVKAYPQNQISANQYLKNIYAGNASSIQILYSIYFAGK